MNRYILGFVILYLVLPLNLLANETPHHVYIGIFAGSDSRNPSSGGWDNDNAYSVDREMVQWQGKNFAFEQTYMDFGDRSSDVSAITFLQLELIWYYGRVPMVNLLYGPHQSCQETFVQLDNDFSNPSSEAYRGLVRWAQGLKRWLELGIASGENNRFIMLALLPEANFSACAKEADQSTWDFVDPAAYKSIFVKGRKIIESVINPKDTRRIHWTFAPNNVSNRFMPGFEAYYPGDQLVDWLGLSAFNFAGYKEGSWSFPCLDFDDLVRPILDRLRRLSPRKPLALLQTGSLSIEGDKQEWIQKFFHDAALYPKLYLIIYFNTVRQGEFIPPGLDWPIYWNDPYDARPYGFNTYHPQMRYTSWLTTIENPYLVFSPIPLPSSGAFAAAKWDVENKIAPISNQYELFPELRYRSADFDHDGVSNWAELCAGLDPLVKDRSKRETDCHDGIDNDANGRTDADDTVRCGDLPLAEKERTKDNLLYRGEYRYFQFIVPEGSTLVNVTLQNSGGAGDLYVRHAARPTTSRFDYRTLNTGGIEQQLSIPSPASGLWHLLIYGIKSGDYTVEVKNSFTTVPKIGAADALIVCDIDRNGKDDLVFSIPNHGIQIYANNSTWLNLIANGLSPASMGCGDLQGDGIPRVIASWPGNNSLKMFLVNSWIWQEINIPGKAPDTILVKDLDGDGKDEIIGIFKEENSLMVRRGNTGQWETIPLAGAQAPDRILFATFTSSKTPKLVALWHTQNMIMVYDLITQLWTALALPFSTAPDLLDVADVDGDGISDLFAVWNRWGGPLSTQVRIGFNGEWLELRHDIYNHSMPSIISVGDVDSDNKEDLILLYDAWGFIQTYLQSWKGWDTIYIGQTPRLIAVGNFDGDSAGRKDIAMVWENDFRIWMNNTELVDVPFQANPSQLHVFIRGRDDVTYQMFWDGIVWNGWFPLGGSSLGSPEAVNYNGQLRVFATGKDHGLYQTFWDGTKWNGWSPLGGSLANGPAAVSYNGQIHVFAAGKDQQVYQMIWDGINWNGWFPLGGSMIGSPEVVIYNGQLHLFATGKDRVLYQMFWDGINWNGWFPLGGAPADGPAVVSYNGQLHVFVVRADHMLYQMFWDGTKWNGWFPLGGKSIGSPEALSYNGQLHVFVVGEDRSLYQMIWDGTKWHERLSLGGSTLSGPTAATYLADGK
jgi:hypothetical protein